MASYLPQATPPRELCYCFSQRVKESCLGYIYCISISLKACGKTSYSYLKPGPNEDESCWEFKLSLSFGLNSHALSSTLLSALSSNLNLLKFFIRVLHIRELKLFSRLALASWLSMRVDENSHESQLLTTLLLVWPGLPASKSKHPLAV